jgi:hypothetical protein
VRGPRHEEITQPNHDRRNELLTVVRIALPRDARRQTEPFAMGAFRSKAGNSAAQTGRSRQSKTPKSYLAGVIQRPWQESNLRHTV